MSRDWTPMEFIMVEEDVFARTGKRMSDAKLSMVTKDGNKPMWNDDARREYPYLSFLFPRFETDLYPKIRRKCQKKVYAEIEEEIAGFAKEIKERMRNGDRKHISLDGIVCDEFVHEWFLGKLDKNFYYAERNNEIFMSYINGKIRREERNETAGNKQGSPYQRRG